MPLRPLSKASGYSSSLRVDQKNLADQRATGWGGRWWWEVPHPHQERTRHYCDPRPSEATQKYHCKDPSCLVRQQRLYRDWRLDAVLVNTVIAPCSHPGKTNCLKYENNFLKECFLHANTAKVTVSLINSVKHISKQKTGQTLLKILKLPIWKTAGNFWPIDMRFISSP